MATITPEERESIIRDITRSMLRDHRFKKIMLSHAEHIFQDIEKDERKILLRDALKEVIDRYSVRNSEELYRIVTEGLTPAEQENPDRPKRGRPKTRHP